MKKPFFSIVIPLYNKQNYIIPTINSILKQTFTNFEVIIIDDKSTDNSLATAESISDERIRYVNHLVNKGLSASRNTGIAEAKGEIIAFLDADDTWQTEYLEKIHALTIRYPQAQLYAAKYKEVYREAIVEHNFKLKTGLLDNFFLANLNQPIYCPSGLCVKKTVFDTVGYYDETITLGEDVDLNIRLHLKCIMAFCNEALVNYTMESENQITRSSLTNKVITDFNKYEAFTDVNPGLKKFLDLNRYIMAKQYNTAGDIFNYKKMVSGIRLSNLNYKQILLLHAPSFVLKAIKTIKAMLIKKGLNPTSY